MKMSATQKQTFASGAEAIAHFFHQGYTTIGERTGLIRAPAEYRMMYNPDNMKYVRIDHVGFLEWEAILED